MAKNGLERLIEVKRKDRRLVIGLMSGTSADGVSAVLVELKGCGVNTRYKILAYKTYPYPSEVREKIFSLFDPKTSTVDEICFMNFILGEIFAEAALKIAKEANIDIEDIDLIGSHGQTIYHQPNPRSIAGYESRATLQIGEPSVIAERTGRITVADFRPRDVAAGGQGAPIVAYVDYILFRHEEKNRAVQNIGGIANVTYIPRKADINDIIAFDTGPGNMVIDAIVYLISKGEMTYDKDGRIAAKGTISEELLEWLMGHPFIKKRPPKTTGREEFGLDFARKVYNRGLKLGLRDEDIVATVTAFTAKSIAYSYEKFLPERVDEMILGGGGCFNKTLVKMLKEYLGYVKILFHEDFGIPAQAKEPLLMAILANEVICGNPNNAPSATGARRNVVMGKILL
ncbi:MAG: anhydro-N-acetylmuramic acid kinase [Thermoprotei archaeon]|nr:MAG: anhydro-N-acetylmuramic acid kinase [Thermoprotei archaeon]